jgi:hypothetical protein
MNISIDRLPGGVSTRTTWICVALMLSAMLLTACGSSESDATSPVPTAAICNPADPATASECGTLLIGLTDADGDFLSYTVDVVSLILEKADGSVVETMPATTRIDFSQYVELTELIASATLPP